MKYQRIAGEIEAFQWDGSDEQLQRFPWMVEALKKQSGDIGSVRIFGLTKGGPRFANITGAHLVIKTNLYNQTNLDIAIQNDYIILCKRDGIYTLPPEQFNTTFEPLMRCCK